MFNIKTSITPLNNKPRLQSKYRHGIITFHVNQYLVRYKDVNYPIKKIDRFVGQVIYSTHFNDKHPLGTQRVLNKLDNLKIINKYWYPVYITMKVDFVFINQVAIIHFKDAISGDKVD
jgi:hypothetical protein